MPIWYRLPPAETWEQVMGGTPMCGALFYCQQIASGWCADPANARSFPPTVIHLTDGEPTDEPNPEPYAEQLKAVETQDGNLLLFNCHLSASREEPVVFPADEAGLRDPYAQMLFRMSSRLPETMRDAAVEKGLPAHPGARAMAFNADSTKMLHLINIGTRMNVQPSPMRPPLH